MAKVRINKLPEGYKLKGGKVVKSSLPNMSRTGDQSDFGLVTFTGNSNINGSSGPFSTVNKTLTAEPRDQANLEAEKGETALTAQITVTGQIKASYSSFTYNVGDWCGGDSGTADCVVTVITPLPAPPVVFTGFDPKDTVDLMGVISLNVLPSSI